MAKTLRSSRGPARLSARPTCPSKLGTAVSEKTVCLTESRSADATTTARRGECCGEQTPARRRRRGRTSWVPSACHLKTRNFKFYAFIENFFIPRKRTRSPAGALFPRAVCWMERLHLTSLCLCPRGTRRGLEGGGADSRTDVRGDAFLFVFDPHQSQAGERPVGAATHG